MTKVGVVIPCYKVKNHILDVIKEIGKEVSVIYVVDDSCPQKTGNYVEKLCTDPRVKVLYNTKNLGVGGAVMHGYKKSLEDEIDVVVKVDGDGQMDPKLIPKFIAPIIEGRADYSKGNRFFNPESIVSMPIARIIGNALLSFLTKLSSGYWNIFDPTNGYTAIHTNVIRHLALQKINNRYFFESDILFRLNIIRAVVVDISMDSTYGNEKSNLSINRIIVPFLYAHLRNTFKRLIYNYYIRDFSFASIELIFGLSLLFFGLIYGSNVWIEGVVHQKLTSSGTVMLVSLPIILGTQLILSFINYDIAMTPRISSLTNLDKAIPQIDNLN